ncbi:MAG: hypothetical protein GY805_30690 [Chloroflexi bacterium]|nr:hypothetical protein [Chloroflexota bacterium]
MFKSYIDPAEDKEARRKLPKLMVEGLLLGGAGLGVLALIFEIAADAFSVAAYQTLLAIHGADGQHQIAILAFIVLSALLFLGIVPAYKAGAYLRPNAGGSGPLVEAIGPPKMRWLSWIGTSLFFLDAILTIIISSISASDVTMLILPELAAYRIALAELFAFFIMVVLVALGPQRAVPIFLIGGGAFTLFTIGALSIVGSTALGNPEWAFLTEGIVSRLQSTGVVEEVIRNKETLSTISNRAFFQLFFHSMSSAMLGFSGYEVIPASGKHAARPKWKVINTALTLAAVFLIGTGMVQLYAAQQWNIPATEGYSTLLIEYEINAVQTFGKGLTPEGIIVSNDDLEQAELFYEEQSEEHEGEAFTNLSESHFVEETAYNIAVARAIEEAITGTPGQIFLIVAGTLLAIILLLAQGGGYIGGAAVAANAARLGRLPSMFADDRIGIAVIWGISAVLIPIIREVVVVESYYAFGFVSAFVITSTTVFFVRHEIMRQRGIEPGSAEAKSLRFAGLRGMIASYFMMIVLITQKTDALWVIAIFGAVITLFQYFVAHGGLKRPLLADVKPSIPLLKEAVESTMGVQRAHDEARQRGIVDIVNELIEEGSFNKFNVGPIRIRELICYLYDLEIGLFHQEAEHYDDIEEPSADLEETYSAAYTQRNKILEDVEYYSHFGIFTFIHNYHINWVAEEHGRDASIVTKAMLNILFPQTEHAIIWEEFSDFKAQTYPEPIWQFSRRRYLWAKDQWPNLSDRITTIWTLQDFGLIPKDINVETIIAVADGKKQVLVKIPSNPKEDDERKMHKKTIEESSNSEDSVE